MKYKTILADPPWEYRNKSVLGAWGSNGAVKFQYPTMSTLDICNLKIIKEVRAKDSILLLWATIPNFPEAWKVMAAWGYEYKTSIIWVKTKTLSMGYWFRSQCEMCLLGIRGSIKAFRSSQPNLFFAPVIRHSQKPETFFHLIEPYVPAPRIELFARQKREGWDAWGNEIISPMEILTEEP